MARPLTMAGLALTSTLLLAFPAPDGLADGAGRRKSSIATLVSQLDPSNPDRVRLQATLLLGRVGGSDALRAVATAFQRDEYPPVKATSAAILGRTGDVRWVPMLHKGLSFSEAVVVKACRLSVRALVKRFKSMKDRLKRYVYHVDLKGMREATGRNDNLLTTLFQEQMLIKLYDIGGFEFGKEMDLRDEVRNGVFQDERVGILYAGSLQTASLVRTGTGGRATVGGDLRILLEGSWEPVSPKVSARVTRTFTGVDEYTEDGDLLSEAIGTLVDKLHRKLWPYVR